jgi:hypothetical protein
MSERLQVIHGSPYAIRLDGEEGFDPTDNSYSSHWTTVLKLIGDQYMPCRRYRSYADALSYCETMVRARHERRKQETA